MSGLDEHSDGSLNGSDDKGETTKQGGHPPVDFQHGLEDHDYAESVSP